MNVHLRRHATRAQRNAATTTGALELKCIHANSAQVTLVKGDLRGIAQARLISQDTVANMKQNPRLRLRLQRARRAAGGRRAVPVHRLAALADERGAGHEPEFGVGHLERLAPARIASQGVDQ